MVYWIYKQNSGAGAESLQEQLGTILAQNPNPTLGHRTTTHIQLYRAVLARTASCSCCLDPGAQVTWWWMCVWVWKGPWPWF